MDTIKLVVFDLDGVIFDSEPMHAASIARVIRRYGVEYDTTKNAGFSCESMLRRVISEFGINAEPEDMVLQMTELDEQKMAEQNLQPSDGLIELLEFFRSAGIEMAVASSSERRFVEYAVAFFHLDKYFSVIVTGSEVERKKPAPDLYRRAVELSHHSASRAAAVEDTTTGVKAAKSAGLRCFGYANPTSGRQDLSGADWVVDRLGKIKDIYMSENLTPKSESDGW